MTPIDKVPDLNWTENSFYEIIAAGGDELVQRSNQAWRFNNLFIAGLVYNTLTSPPWFWFALTKEVKFKDLIDFRKIKDYIPLGSLTAVAEDFDKARRFAEFYGFEKTEQEYEFKGRNYLIYRRV